ncbi:STAS/SEC14 domain-containing protein [Thalassomonas sp. M1454]|uniref:STAS/SEC14 domain-containing protein n=1 Tax=Thalassomonas sp. M1454 TaxID=2594477 RepID=UPI0011814A91|nr:STAS/SEC14 domain-containing protein [Thalassomonas sp. M1454]TRX55648.1 STAS/SEC14 domain-containing protein [Thalassomonas sp. M1454]
MLNVSIQRANAIAVLEPVGALTQDDFIHAASIIDPYMQANGYLNGILIFSKDFPGWESFSAMASHMEFIKEHHQFVSRIAIVTDSVLGNFASLLSGHFVHSEIKWFNYDDIDSAQLWLLTN